MPELRLCKRQISGSGTSGGDRNSGQSIVGWASGGDLVTEPGGDNVGEQTLFVGYHQKCVGHLEFVYTHGWISSVAIIK